MDQPDYYPIMNNQDDVLEYALNFGISSSSNRFNLSCDEVRTIVKRFMDEVSGPCTCEAVRLQGQNMMCCFCSGPEMSSSLKSFNWNS